MSAANDTSTWIAITGLAGRFPGARNIAQFWRNLRDGIESIAPLTDADLRAAGVASDDLANPAYIRRAAILDDYDRFDAAFFGFSPKDAAVMDPQHRLFLECAWEALESAAWAPDQFAGRIGVYAGSGMNSYLIHNLLTNTDLVRESGIFLLKQTGNDKDVLATRVSYQLNLTGPSLAVQTACSTSLVAVHLACQSLLNQECDMALAGGVTIEIPHGCGYLYREGEILARDGHCRAFDAQSSGTIFGSGVGIVTLRRFDDAIRDGDPIRAVIRGTAINNDGARKVGYLAPSVTGQAEVIREALAVAQVDARTIAYVETHGTGTRVGDPIEVQALTEAYRASTNGTSFCAIGSLKTNIGHLDAAAGVAGLIKTVLALEHRQIPASLNYAEPNPLIDFAHSPFFVNAALRDWPTDNEPRRAAVTSLGIGGTNAHVILEQAPQRAPAGDAREGQLLTLSAKSPGALATIAQNLAEYLADNPIALADVAQTLHLGRTALPFRHTLVCRDSPAAAIALGRIDHASLPQRPAATDPTVIFLFSGQGAQYPGMARELYEAEQTFRATVDFCCEFLRPLLGCDLRTVIFPADPAAPEAENLLNQTRLTQPALFVIEYALAQLWRTWGVQPAAMFGHSVGEFAVAVIAGVLSLESALAIVAERGRLMQSLPAGVMTAAMLSETDLQPLMIDGLAIAGVNAEDQCVVSGPVDRVAEFESRLAARNVSFRRLRVSHAFHSAMMDPILGPFTEFLRGVTFAPPRIRYISSATGTWITPAEAVDPGYWARQLRDTVRFVDGVAQLLAIADAIFVEVGPGSTLIGLAGQHSDRATNHRFVPSIRRRDEPVADVTRMLESAGALWAAGRRLDWAGFHAGEARRRIELPSYPFERKRHWIEPGRPLTTTAVTEAAPEPSRPPPGLRLYQPVWRPAEAEAATRDQCGPWLIFQDDIGLGATLIETLRRRGEDCAAVTAGDRYDRTSSGDYQINPRSRTDYDRLLNDLSDRGQPPRTIVHLWSVVDGTFDSILRADPAEALAPIEEASFYSLLYLAQAVGAMDPTAAIEIGVVSNHLQGVSGDVSGDAIFRPERALLLGVSGVIPKELLNVRCRAMDFAISGPGSPYNGALGDALRATARLIAGELRSASVDPVIAFRNGRRWARDFALADDHNRTPAFIPLERGVYLITGGLGGIGLELAGWLARTAHARLVLLGRSTFPDRDSWPTWLRDHDDLDPVAAKIHRLQALEAAGAEIVVAAGDVTDLSAMRNLVRDVRDRFGAIDGVIHAAGVLEDAPLMSKDAIAAARVLAPKVRGTLNLVAAFADAPPPLLALMSSVSSVLTPAGQIDYAAANAFLDTFAQARAHLPDCRTIAIQWPRWRDVGMAASFDRANSSDALHPLLQQLRTSNDRGRVYTTELRLERDWIVGEHRLKRGGGLLPGTAYLEIMRAAIAPNAPPDRALTIRNLDFKAPLNVEPGATRIVELAFRQVGNEYRFAGRNRDSSRADQWIECATGAVSIGEAQRPTPCPIAKIQRRCRSRTLSFADGQNAKQQRYIDFGPHWRALKQIRIGRNEALAFCELPAEFLPELAVYRFHPALADMATGSALFLIGGYDSIDCLYVPIGYERITLYGALPGKCYSHVRSRSRVTIADPIATFDLTIADEAGNVIAEIENFSLRQVRDPASLERPRTSRNPAGAAVDPRAPIADDSYPDSIAAAAGVAAFPRLLSQTGAANLILFPSDFTAALRNAHPAAPTRHLTAVASLAPRDEVEVTLAEWWKSLLGLERVSIREDFFALGGQSLAALRLFAQIKKKYGLELGLSVLYSAPTIEALARLVRKEEAPPTSVIVPIQPRGDRPPLFLIHGLLGTLNFFNDFVAHCEPDQPILGVQSQMLAGATDPVMSMEELAQKYLVEIRAVQPHGPYYFLGYSFGGVLAFEMAQQLAAAHEPLGMLGMLDTREAGLVRDIKQVESRRAKLARWGLRAQRELRHAVKGPGRIAHFAQVVADRFNYQLIPRLMREIHLRFARAGRRLPWFLLNDHHINEFAAGEYRPRPYAGKITLFRAARGIASADERFGSDLGWERWTTQGVEVHEIPGTHEDLMTEPNVRVVAQEVAGCLTRGRRTGGRDSIPSAAAERVPPTGLFAVNE
jgi:acyl transferase domain-containing protein/thioesterase domain-containing protein/NAD(P)-dependent dehydrogenase (short-subunit alcohol dehydrogenase family)/acyl carrier protein